MTRANRGRPRDAKLRVSFAAKRDEMAELPLRLMVAEPLDALDEPFGGVSMRKAWIVALLVAVFGTGAVLAASDQVQITATFSIPSWIALSVVGNGDVGFGEIAGGGAYAGASAGSYGLGGGSYAGASAGAFGGGAFAGANAGSYGWGGGSHAGASAGAWGPGSSAYAGASARSYGWRPFFRRSRAHAAAHSYGFGGFSGASASAHSAAMPW